MMAILEACFSGQVALFVQDGLGNERDPKDGYEIIDTGPRLTRFKRMSVWGVADISRRNADWPDNRTFS